MINTLLKSGFQITLILLGAIFIIGCDKSSDPIEPSPLGIKDTLTFNVSLNLDQNTYVFNPKPGNDYFSNDQGYATLGGQGSYANGEIYFFEKYIELVNNDENVSIKIGFKFRPNPIIYDSRHGCQSQTNLANSLLGEQHYALCSSSIYNDYLDCLSLEENKLFFEIEFEDLTANKKYKSGINSSSNDTFFRIDKVQKLHYEGPIRTLSFDYLIEGEFNVILHRYDFAGTEYQDSLIMQNSQFQIGFWDLDECND